MPLGFKVTVHGVGSDTPTVPPASPADVTAEIIGPGGTPDQPLGISFALGVSEATIRLRNRGGSPAVFPTINVQAQGAHAAKFSAEVDQDNFTIAPGGTHDMTLRIEADEPVGPTVTVEIDVEYVEPTS